jgi:hypothetical protein
LIERARNRVLVGDERKENHHIIPRCMGGSNDLDNRVDLTLSEHFLAHQLLVKIYPNNLKLIFALYMMTISKDKKIRNNKRFSWIKKANLQARKNFRHSKETKIKMSLAHKGKPKKEDRKENPASFKTGCIPWNKGKKFPNRILSQEHKDAISAGLTGKPKSKNQVRKMVESRKKNGTDIPSEQSKKKISKSVSRLKWYTNGIINLRLSIGCPFGFSAGRLYIKKRSK